jgi:Flp pilus assembly protein TadG
MANTSLIATLRQRLRELRTANGANVTVTFALATIPMVGFVGAAVDYSHANAVKAAMQMAADSTALMLSKNASTLTSSEFTTKANSYFKAMFTRTDATGLLVSATYTTDGGQKVVVNASSNVKTNFMGLMGFSSMKVAVDSQVKWGNSKLRVALALDVTGSMAADGKMTALKTATNSLLDQLKAAAATNGDVLVSIIPFSKDVNVGKSNYTATWIDWTAWDAANGGSSSTTGFVNYGNGTWCWNGWYWNGSSLTYGTCPSTGSTSNHVNWNGCVTDRGLSTQPHSTNYDTSVLAPTTSVTASLFAAEQYSDCPVAIMTLGYDWTAMKALVTSLVPAGNTNQGIGLAHAWMSLVGGGPYPTPPTEDPNYKYTKVIILMSDGLNTQNRWYTNENQIDKRQELTCANVKAAGIVLYTLHVNTGGDPMSTLLQGCASSTDKFFHLTSATQLVGTFQKIATELSNLRISQ